ncbi:DNA pilot protein [Microvirus sp.]|nr:DNA pilot protein [Microvirus sp.]
MLLIKFRDVGNTEFMPHHNKYILGAIISGAGSLLGGAIGAIGSSHAADKSLQATRETNKANRELAQYQNEWNLAQWYRQNAYNSPSAQRQRYEQAGINPYFALGNITPGNAQGNLESSNMANQQSGAESYNMLAQGYQNLGSSIADATQKFYGTQFQQEQIKALQIQNSENLLSMMYRVQGLRYDNQAKRMANEVYNANMQSLINMTKNQERESYARVAQANLQTVGTEYDNAAKAFTNKFILPAQRDMAQMTIQKMVSEIAYQKAQERWTEKQTALAAKYAAASMLSANASWLSSKAAWNTSLSNASSVENQNWYRTQQNTRESTRFGIESKYLERSIKLGVDQLDSQFRFQKSRENLWLNSGGFNRFMWTSGELFNQVSPLKFGFGK